MDLATVDARRQRPYHGVMYVLVTGGRDFNDGDKLREALWTLHDKRIDVLVHGSAKGADSIAREWALNRHHAGDPIRIMGFRADWDKHGNAAGPMRNQRMVDYLVTHRDQSLNDVLVLACPGGRGTADCVRRAKAAGLTVKTLDEVLR